MSLKYPPDTHRVGRLCRHRQINNQSAVARAYAPAFGVRSSATSSANRAKNNFRRQNCRLNHRAPSNRAKIYDRLQHQISAGCEGSCRIVQRRAFSSLRPLLRRRLQRRLLATPFLQTVHISTVRNHRPLPLLPGDLVSQLSQQRLLLRNPALQIRNQPSRRLNHRAPGDREKFFERRNFTIGSTA